MQNAQKNLEKFVYLFQHFGADKKIRGAIMIVT